MYNYNKLRGLIREHCGTQKKYAEEIDVSVTQVVQRLKGRIPFTQEEILKTKELFGLSNDELVAVFFTQK